MTRGSPSLQNRSNLDDWRKVFLLANHLSRLCPEEKTMRRRPSMSIEAQLDNIVTIGKHVIGSTFVFGIDNARNDVYRFNTFFLGFTRSRRRTSLISAELLLSSKECLGFKENSSSFIFSLSDSFISIADDTHLPSDSIFSRLTRMTFSTNTTDSWWANIGDTKRHAIDHLQWRTFSIENFAAKYDEIRWIHRKPLSKSGERARCLWDFQRLQSSLSWSVLALTVGL